MAFDQRVKWYFTDLKAIFRWITILILYIKQYKHFSSRRPPPLRCLYNTCSLAQLVSLSVALPAQFVSILNIDRYIQDCNTLFNYEWIFFYTFIFSLNVFKWYQAVKPSPNYPDSRSYPVIFQLVLQALDPDTKNLL